MLHGPVPVALETPTFHAQYLYDIGQLGTHVSDYAIYGEYSPESKQAEPGWNIRVFTRIEAQAGDRIRLDMETGIITLAPDPSFLLGREPGQ